jgi:hypothetical protein
VGEDQAAGTRCGGDLPSLAGREVGVLLGEGSVGVGEGGLADQQVRIVGQLEGGITQTGIHDEGELLAAAWRADVGQADPPAAPLEPALALQAPDVRAADAAGDQLGGQHAAAVGLGEAVADRGDAVRQRAGLQPEGGAVGEDGVGLRDRLLAQRQRVVEQRQVPDAVEDVRPGGRVGDLDGAGDLVKRHPLEDAGQPQAVVAVEVGDADPGDLVRGDAGEQHLALGPLTRVEQQPLSVPAQEVPVVVASAGRGLTRGAEDDQLTVGHGPTLIPRTFRQNAGWGSV